MLCSIVIPVYKHIDYLGNALRSCALVMQDMTHEILLIDDKNESPIRTKLNKFALLDNVRIVDNVYAKGISGALNSGISAANGIYIVRLDADDELHYYIRKSLLLLTINDSSVCFGGAVHFPGLLYQKVSFSVKELKLFFAKYNGFVHPGTIVKKEFIESIGGYNTHFDGCEDYHLWLRILTNNSAKISLAKWPHVFYRIHKDQLTKSNTDKGKTELRELARKEVDYQYEFHDLGRRYSRLHGLYFFLSHAFYIRIFRSGRF